MKGWKLIQGIDIENGEKMQHILSQKFQFTLPYKPSPVIK